MTVLLFTQKSWKGKGRFLQQNSTDNHLYKTKVKVGHSKRSKIDNLDLHRKRSFIDQ